MTKLTQETEDVVADEAIETLSRLEGYTPPESEQDWTCVSAAQSIRSLLDERQFLSDRIDVLEGALRYVCADVDGMYGQSSMGIVLQKIGERARASLRTTHRGGE